MCGSWRVVWMIGIASCGGSDNRPRDAAVDTPVDVAIDAPPDGSLPPVACSPMMAPRIATAGVPAGIAIGDIDGNGTRDLVVADTALDVLLGNGDGTFQPAISTVFAAGLQPVAPAIADVDGDGDQDVVVALAGASASALQIVLGDGAGGFTLGVALPGSFTTSIAIGDLDHDGTADIVTASSGVASGLAIHLGIGGGAFAPPVALDATSSYDSVTIADVDGDQLLDLVAPGGMPGTFGELAVFAGNGDGSFEAPFRAATASNYATRAVVGDLDGDGLADIVTAGWVANDEALSVESWLGSGTTFTHRSTLWRGPDLKSDYPPPNEFRGFRGVPALGDVDGDGKLDVVVTFQNRNVVGLIRGTGTGDLASFTEFAMNEQGDNETDGPVDLALVDVSGDGRLDAIVPGTTRSIAVVLGSSISTFRAPRGLPSNLANEGFPAKLAVGDVDGDGQQDFAMGTVSYDGDPFMGVIFVVRSGGPTRVYALPNDPNISNPQNDQVRLRDLDGDGDLDLVVAVDRVTQGWLSVYLNAGDGTFGPRVDFATGITLDLAIGDLDGDGKPELVLVAIDVDTFMVTTTVFQNYGTGAFTAQPAFASPDGMLLADVNHDAKLDFVHWGGPVVSVRTGNGDGTFGAPIDTATPAAVQHVVVADIDGDGTLDLGADTFALIGHGDGTFTAGGALPAAPGGLMALADLDGIAPIDVAGTTGAVYRAGTTEQADAWTIVASDLRDVTGDGHPDAIGIMRRANTAFVLSSQCP